MKSIFNPLPPGLSLLNIWVFLATVGGVGQLRWAPGTAGSIVALPGAWLLYIAPDLLLSDPWNHSGWIVLTVATILVSVIGIQAGDHVERYGGVSDPGAVVIDEVAGQWLTLVVALIFVSDGAAFSWLGLAAAFCAFRFFDVLKPWPCSWADRRLHGGLGIMLDDLIAALYAGVATAIIMWLFGGGPAIG